MTRITWT